MDNRPIWINFHVSPKKGIELAKELEITTLKTRAPEISERINETRIAQMNNLGFTALRPGFGETGWPVFGTQGLKGVRVGRLVTELVSRGYKASSSLWIETHCRDDKGKISEKKKHVITVVLAIPDGSPGTVVLSSEFLNNFVARSDRGSWARCHVWRNRLHDAVELLGPEDTLAKRYNRLLLNRKGGYVTEQVSPPEKMPLP